MKISVKHDLDRLTRNLKDFEKKQIPFATALALNNTAKDGQAAAQKAMEKALDRPTPFTLRGIAVKRATKSNQESVVYIKDIQAEYLRWQITGGTRKARNKALLVPENIRLNKYGNMPRGRINKLRDKKNIFSGEVDGVSGVYQRYKRKAPRLLVSYEKDARYGVKYPFAKIVKKTVARTFPDNFRGALAYAALTAR